MLRNVFPPSRERLIFEDHLYFIANHVTNPHLFALFQKRALKLYAARGIPGGTGAKDILAVIEEVRTRIAEVDNFSCDPSIEHHKQCCGIIREGTANLNSKTIRSPSHIKMDSALEDDALRRDQGYFEEALHLQASLYTPRNPPPVGQSVSELAEMGHNSADLERDGEPVRSPGKLSQVETALGKEQSETGNIDDWDTAPPNQAELLPSLEILMLNHGPLDLSGLVIIPDHGNPAHGGLADVHAGFWGDTMVQAEQAAIQLLMNLKVAVKVLRIYKNRKADADWEASNERRITREMHVWCALRHPNISEFLGYSTDFSDYPAMISMWCRQGTASEYLDRQDLPLNKRIRLARGVSEGLRFLHQLKVVHGDLKPSNVLVDDAGVARLCDFGLVRLVDWGGPAGMTTSSPYTGTERYKAPELFISADNRHPVATFEGDIYSLGCIMLEFIEQLYPFQRFRRTHELRDVIMDGYPPALRSETTIPCWMGQKASGTFSKPAGMSR